MKIQFDKLILEYNTKHGYKKSRSPEAKWMTKSSLAREMVKLGKFSSFQSCLNLMHYHQHGKAKSVDFELIEYLSKKFGKDYNELIN